MVLSIDDDICVGQPNVQAHGEEPSLMSMAGFDPRRPAR
jgi:hypothetical protein